MNMLSGFRSLFLTVLLLILSFGIRAQVLLTESFEDPFPTPGWTFTNIGGGWGWEANYYPNTGTNGSKSIVCSASDNNRANAWAFSPAVSLNPNTLYRISYWYRCSIFGGSTESIKVTIGNSATVANQTSIIHDYPALNNATFVEGIDTITVPVSGTYNIAFNYYSSAQQNLINLDSVVITKIIPTPCTGIPEIGVASAPSIVTKGNDFKLSLSGNYLLYSGLQIQWQTSLTGENNFQNIIGANTQNFTTTQNVNSDYRCIVSCANGNTVATSNIVRIKLSDWGSGFREKFVGNTGGYISGMSFLTPSTGFVSFSRDIGFTQDSGQTYIRRPINIGNVDYNGYAVNLTFGFSVRGVHAFSKDSLLVYGDYSAGPAILFSANQGLTWKLVFHQLFALNPDIGNSVFDLKFLTASNAIAINLKEIIQTNDRGQTWNVLYHINPFYSKSRFTKISAPTPDVFYVAAGDYIFKQIYSYVFGLPVPTSTGLDYNTVSFVSVNTGYITRDDNNAVYKTVNGGDTWFKVNDINTSPVFASDLHFINDSTGFAADKDGYNILKTTDNGVTWEKCKKNTSYQYGGYGMKSLFFLNNETGWVGGLGEYLMLTTSGGSPTIPKAVFKIDTTNLQANNTIDHVSLSKSYYQHKWYKNNVLISTAVNASYIHDISIVEDTIKLVVSNGTDSDTMIKYRQFVYTLPPVINSFTPSGVGANGVVTITGIGFIHATSVTFGNAPAVSYTVNSNASITAIVGGGLSGDIVITTPNGSDTASGFTYLLPPKPSVLFLSPASGSIGTTVTITGTNFNPVAGQNIVHFGKVKAVVLSANANQIICKVPVGASFSPITVVNLSTKLMGASTKPFAVTFESHNIVEPGSFKKALVIPHDVIPGITVYPLHMTIGDIDADGKNDIIVVMHYVYINDSVFIYRNKSTPNNFVFDQKMWVANGSYSAIADINNDGLLDLMVGNATGSISVLINAGSPGGILSFKPPVNISGLNGVNNLCVGDVNGDGKPDLLMAGFNDQAIGILLNTSFGNEVSFANLISIFPGGSPRSVTLGDLDGDGKNEIIAGVNGNSLPPFTAIYKNISNSGVLSLSPVIKQSGVFGLEKIFAADLNNDNKLDVVTANDPQSGLNKDFSVYPNSSTAGNISFAPQQDFANTNSRYALTGELDNITGDSLVDYIASTYYDSYFSVYKNISSAGGVNFDIPKVYGPSSGFETTICSADLDGDGKPEINLTQISGIEIFKNKIEDPIEIILCPPASSFSILSNVQGGTYQWQQDAGNGFVNLANDALITGSKTDQLTITNAPTSYYGYQYRCVAVGKLSSVSVIKFSNRFTRNYNNDWNYAGNWSCFTLPDKYTDVIIGGNVTVEVNSNVEVKSLTISPFSNVKVNQGFTLKINH